MLVIAMVSYIEKTEIPIIAEFCAELYIFEEFLLTEAAKSQTLQRTIKLLENKKRAALERKIYTSELNATIGANLLKTWREEKPEIPTATHRAVTIFDFDNIGISEAEQKIIHNALLCLSTKKNMSIEIKLHTK
jgi:hypothetical protein